MVKGYKGFRSHNEWFEFAVPKYGYSLRIAVALEQCKLAIPYIKFRQKKFFFSELYWANGLLKSLLILTSRDLKVSAWNRLQTDGLD